MPHDDLQPADQPHWHQINVQFDNHSAAERSALARLGPVLATAESTGLLTSWFFIRKQWWRFRYLPTSSATASEATRLLEDAARSMRESGHASRWVHNIYEPETHAFGGAEGIAAAHHLFHADSRHIGAHLGPDGDPTWTGTSDQNKRRELSILLCTALMRAAGQDRYEQGDIWAKVADHRLAEINAQPEQWDRFKAALQRLITVETGPGTALRTSALEAAGDWLTAFERAGRTLRTLGEVDLAPA
jgi:thiopeptide-type bacteriocin biosynthesis protein